MTSQEIQQYFITLYPDGNILQQIAEFSDRCHNGQQRKYTHDPYIIHPISVMKICFVFTQDITILAAALLHDVLEDTPVNSSRIIHFLRPHMDHDPFKVGCTLKYILELTDVFTKEAYPHLNRKQRKVLEAERLSSASPQAQTIKYADIIDNTRSIVAYDPKFAATYLPECMHKLQIATNGNKILHAAAIQSITQALKTIQDAQSR